jgi:hypothetical protein
VTLDCADMSALSKRRHVAALQNQAVATGTSWLLPVFGQKITIKPSCADGLWGYVGG